MVSTPDWFIVLSYNLSASDWLVLSYSLMWFDMHLLEIGNRPPMLIYL